jgi:DNA-binding MarR family transcriptional regulator
MSFPPYPLKLPIDDRFLELDPDVPQHRDLSPEAKVVYAALGAYHGPDLTGFSLLEQLAQETGMTSVTVVRHLAELKRAGVVR